MAVLTYLGLMWGMTVRGLELPRSAGLVIGISTTTGLLIVAVLGGMLLNRWIFATDSSALLSPQDPRRFTTGVTLAISSLVLFGLALWGGIAALSLTQRPLLGPEPISWFALIGNSVSYGVPILMLAGALFSFGWRERSEPLLFAAQLMLNLFLSAVYMIERIEHGGTLDAEAWIQLAIAMPCSRPHSRLLGMEFMCGSKGSNPPMLLLRRQISRHCS